MTRLQVSFRTAALVMATVGASFSLDLSASKGQTPIQVRPPVVRAAGAPQAPELTAEVNQIVSQGAKLESQRRWGEALSLYEDEVRKRYEGNNPSIAQLFERIDLAKIHYDLGRRYADGSFRRSIASLDESRALELYGEVLTKIYAHYVQEPDWKHLLDRGTRDVDVALNEADFVANNPMQATVETVNDFRRRLHNLTDNRPVRSREELRDVVASAAHLARAELGLSPTAVILEYTAGAAGGLDEYSTFLTADQLTDLYSQIEGNFVGLGVELKAAENALLIVNVIHGSPAERAGIKAGDRLVAVAGKATRDLTTDQAAELLQGGEGTSVELMDVTFERSAAPRRGPPRARRCAQRGRRQDARPGGRCRLSQAHLLPENDEPRHGRRPLEALSPGNEEPRDGPPR